MSVSTQQEQLPSNDQQDEIHFPLPPQRERMLPQVYTPPRPNYGLQIAVSLVLACIMAVVFLSGGWAISDASATITLLPKQNTLPVRFTQFVPVHTLQGKSALGQTTVATTGTVNHAAQAAHGQMTLYNGAPFSITIAAGTTIPLSNGVTIVLDEQRTVPKINYATASEGSITVPAHSTPSGALGNVSAYALKQVVCCGQQGNIRASNTTAFTGGRDAALYHTVSRSDVQQAASTAVDTLTAQAQTALHATLAPGEQLSTTEPISCSPTAHSDRAIGSRADRVTVSVQVLCQGDAYSYTSQQAIAAVDQREMQHPAFPSPFRLSSVSITAIEQQASSLQGSVLLLITGEEHWTYQWDQEHLQTLARAITGMPSEQARTYLTHEEGVGSVVSLQQSFLGGDTLPTDPHRITIVATPLP